MPDEPLPDVRACDHEDVGLQHDSLVDPHVDRGHQHLQPCGQGVVQHSGEGERNGSGAPAAVPAS